MCNFSEIFQFYLISYEKVLYIYIYLIYFIFCLSENRLCVLFKDVFYLR